MPLRDLPLPATFNRHFVLAMSLLIMLLAVALATMVFSPPKNKHIWRIAVTDWPGYDPLYLAAEKGFFEQNGLNIQLIPINAIIDMRTAFERNLIDGYTAPLVDVIESIQTTNIPAKIVLALDYSNGGDQILATPAIPSPLEMGDAHVGVEISSALGRYILTRALNNQQVETTNLHLVHGSQPSLANLAIKGDIDALITFEPYATQVRARRDMRVIFSTTQIPSEIMDVLVVSQKVMDQDPATSQKLQRAWQQALDYASEHPSGTTAIHARRYRITPDEYQTMAKGVQQITVSEMQTLTASGHLAEAIRQASRILTPASVITEERISQTLSITPYVGERK